MSRSGTWGDGFVLACACLLYKRRIIVISSADLPITFASPDIEDRHGADSAEDNITLGFVSADGSSTENHYIYLIRRTPSLVTTPSKTVCPEDRAACSLPADHATDKDVPGSRSLSQASPSSSEEDFAATASTSRPIDNICPSENVSETAR